MQSDRNSLCRDVVWLEGNYHSYVYANFYYEVKIFAMIKENESKVTALNNKKLRKSAYISRRIPIPSKIES